MGRLVDLLLLLVVVFVCGWYYLSRVVSEVMLVMVYSMKIFWKVVLWCLWWNMDWLSRVFG